MPNLEREWDERLKLRGVRLLPANPLPNQSHWKLVRALWFDPEEVLRLGPNHHILLDTLDEQGVRVAFVTLEISWSGGIALVVTRENRGYLWAADYPMSPSLNEFSVRVKDFPPSDTVTGVGIGVDANPGIHTSTLLVFRRVSEAQVK